MIILSKNNTHPYQVITNVNQLELNVHISNNQSDEIISSEVDFYLIVIKPSSYSRVKIVIENELFTGASFTFALNNGGVLEFKKYIYLDNLIANTEDLIIPFRLRLSVINNPFFNNNLQLTASINVYQV